MTEETRTMLLNLDDNLCREINVADDAGDARLVGMLERHKAMVETALMGGTEESAAEIAQEMLNDSVQTCDECGCHVCINFKHNDPTLDDLLIRPYTCVDGEWLCDRCYPVPKAVSA